MKMILFCHYFFRLLLQRGVYFFSCYLVLGCTADKQEDLVKIEEIEDTEDTGNVEDIEEPPLYPDPNDLNSQADPPSPFISFEGEEISTQDQWWETRQPEILDLFAYYAYGNNPQREDSSFVQTAHYEHVFDDLAEIEEFNFYYTTNRSTRVLLIRPTGVINAPVVLGLNRCGNASILYDSRVSIDTIWHNPQCTTGENGRGQNSSQWDLIQMLEAGFAVATVAYGDLAPDVDGEIDRGVIGELELAEADQAAPWGAIGAWAFGLAEISRHLASSGFVDRSRMILFGHSRRGKAALWAATQNPEIAGVWAHQSGTMGASLTRSFEGESLGTITSVFPHWFTPRLSEFVDQETKMPFDQHLLLAALAPRPVLITDGEEDSWADPNGARQSVELARDVYEFLGENRILVQQKMRNGGHDVYSVDWALFLSFAEEQGWE